MKFSFASFLRARVKTFRAKRKDPTTEDAHEITTRCSSMRHTDDDDDDDDDEDGSPRPAEEGGSIRTCRICGDEESRTDELVRPCDCKGSMAFAHRGCVQRWINTAKERSSAACEVCGMEWRGEFCVPPEPASKDEGASAPSDEDKARITTLLVHALQRLGSGRPLPMDVHLVTTWGPLLMPEAFDDEASSMDETNAPTAAGVRGKHPPPRVGVLEMIRSGLRRLMRASSAQTHISE